MVIYQQLQHWWRPQQGWCVWRHLNKTTNLLDKEVIEQYENYGKLSLIEGLCIKVGRGQGDGDVRTRVWGLGTWDLGTRDEGLEDIKYGTRGLQTQGRRGRQWLLKKSEVNRDISHFPREYVLVKATHLVLLRVPPCLFTKRRLDEDSVHWRKLNRFLVFLQMEYWSPKRGGGGGGFAVAKIYVE